MNNIKVSVIVPVYNNEEYIEKEKESSAMGIVSSWKEDVNIAF